MKKYYRGFFLFIVAVAVGLFLYVLRQEIVDANAAAQRAEKVSLQSSLSDFTSENETSSDTHNAVTDSLPDPFAGVVRDKTATLCIHSQARGSGWRTVSGVFLEKDQVLSLKIDEIAGASVRWYQIFPDITQRYNNAYWPNEPKAYQWKGVDKINYLREEISDFRGQWVVSLYKDNRFQYRLPENSVTRSQFFNPSAGSFWYQAEVLKDGRILRSPGIEENTSQGLSAEVFRLTLCPDRTDYIHHLTGFFNVPGIFGSTIRQSTHYIGVDCADVLMAAYTKWKKVPNEKNYNVAMLVNKFPKASEFDLQNGSPDKTVAWGKDVRAGDFIAVRYNGARQYQHIGALYSDRNQNGSLDASDLVIHAGPDPLHLSELKAGNFNGHVVILRPR